MPDPAIYLPLGAHIRTKDGREATVVYQGLDGCGIMWGLHTITDEEEAFLKNCCPLFGDSSVPLKFEHLRAVALVRDPWPTAHMECVGRDFTLISYNDGEEEEAQTGSTYL